MKTLMNNMANILTMARLALLPFMIVLFYLPFQWAAVLCLILFMVGSVTDFLDGWVARKFDQVTEFGKFMDPISDKIFVITTLLMLVSVGRIENLMVLAVVIIIMREFMVSGIREYLGPKNVKLPVTNLAKWKTTSQMIATGCLIVAPYNLYADAFGKILLLIAAILTLITGWKYLQSGLNHIKT